MQALVGRSKWVLPEERYDTIDRAGDSRRGTEKQTLGVAPYRNEKQSRTRLFTLATPNTDFVVAQGSHPEAFTDEVWFGFERVLGAGLEEAQEVLHNGGGCVVAVKVYKLFAVCRGCVNEGRLLCVVDEVAGVDAWFRR